MAKTKDIDPLDVKLAIQRGQLKVYTQNKFGKCGIYLIETQTGETVQIGEVGEGD